MKIINQYNNGNTKVTLYSDGSKIREYHGKPDIMHPESLDVKLTNHCNAGCSFCHEMSTIAGKHGDLKKLGDVLAGLPAGVEIACGGGDPLSHPELVSFLERLKLQGLIVNITINQKHLGPCKDQIINLIERKLVNGVGISYSSRVYLKDILPILSITENVVFHVIMGINRVTQIDELHNFCMKYNKDCKILVLGYKNYGFGLNYYAKKPSIEDNKYQWYIKLASYFKLNNLVLSFDNLAIGQLNLKRYFTDEGWDKFYMGNDFVYTMYIDGVEQTYAPSSTSNERVSFNESSLLNYFQKNKRYE